MEGRDRRGMDAGGENSVATTLLPLLPVVGPLDIRQHQATPGNIKRPRVNKNTKYSSYLHRVMILPQVHLRKPCYDFTFL